MNTIATIPVVVESRVIPADSQKVWEAIRTCQFPFWKLVDKVEVENNETTSVGSSRKVYYKDGTIQIYKILEISDWNLTLIYELIESEPSVSFMSSIHTIKCHPVSHDNSTYVEWRSLFSSDADQQVVQDNQFKKLDGLKDLSEFIKSS